MKKKLLKISTVVFLTATIGTFLLSAKFFGSGQTMEQEGYNSNGCFEVVTYHYYYVAWVPIKVIDSVETNCNNTL